MKPTRGACLCGAVRFHAAAAPRDASFCHCARCRTLAGSAFSAWAAVPLTTLVIEGQEQLRRYASSQEATRGFCERSGALLFTWHTAEPNDVFVALGALDEAVRVTPRYHQYVRDAAPWHRIGDDQPRHDAWPAD